MSTAVRLRTALVIVIVASVVACGGNSSVTPSAVPPLVTPIVVALGDSLTAGPGLAAEEAYPALLQRRIRDAGYPHRVVNAGVSGDTSTDALRRLDAALVPDTRVLIVALGANDGLGHVPLQTIRSNLQTIIERAQARGIRILSIHTARSAARPALVVRKPAGTLCASLRLGALCAIHSAISATSAPPLA